MRKDIIVSAINFRSGGPLSILNDCLEYLDKHLAKEYNIIALVHKKSILKQTQNIEYVEFPNSIKSYLYRFYYEYYYFNKFSKERDVYLWFSLHDMTPNVQTNIQAVYCHNSSPFYKISKKEALLDKGFALFSLLYKYIYQINIDKNDYVIVQQNWLRKKFESMYKINNVVVSYPTIKIDNDKYIGNQEQESEKTVFFYPSFPRVFKNFEIICEAVHDLSEKHKKKVEVILTINGTENKYAQMIVSKYKHIENIKFIGLQSREKVFEIYGQANCLIFPSKLETWGLPISEFKEYKKPMFVANLEYAHETVGNYDKVEFFDSDDAKSLTQLIEKFVDGNIHFKTHASETVASPVTKSWDELFQVLLGDTHAN